VSELLPTGTVTLLLADVEGSPRLWETQPDEMAAAVAKLDGTLCDVIAKHNGVRPVEQGEGESFVVAFARTSDAVACALELQRAPLAPILLRIGVHTGEIQLRDEGNDIGPTINRTARLRDLAHGGQSVLSGTTHDLVADRLPADAWLTDLGIHQLRDLPRPERVVQLCHPDLHNDFPPLRTNAVAAQHLPMQLTSFVGRDAQMTDVRRLLAENRLVTLTGAGGAGKTRLALQVAALMAGEFGGAVWYVDLAPITDPDVVPVAAARALGLPDQPGRSPMDTLTRFIGDRHMLIVLDNCEHLLDASAALVIALLGACPAVTLLATSREPIVVAGEVTWRVPSLSLADEAIELFSDRARRARPDFSITIDNAATVTEICRRLDGMPLAIELAAPRVRALSLAEIVDSLHDRFGLLTGGARTAMPRQQTLRASVDWSHALLTEPERVLFRRLAVFLGGFDFDAAQAVGGVGGELTRYQVLDQLSLLVDKSLVVADDRGGRTRYRLLETVRQYAQEKLGQSGEDDAVHARHRDHYTATAAMFESLAVSDHERLNDWAAAEIDNLRAAFTWSRENGEFEPALRIVSSLQEFWLRRGRIREGLAGFDAVFTDERYIDDDVAAAVWVRAVADRSMLMSWVGIPASLDRAREALAVARELDDTALITRSLIPCAMLAFYDPALRGQFFGQAVERARQSRDGPMMAQILSYQAVIAGCVAGDVSVQRAAAEEGRDLAEASNDPFFARLSRLWLGLALACQGHLNDAAAELGSLVAETQAAQDINLGTQALMIRARVLAYHGQVVAAKASAEAALAGSAAMGGFHADVAYVALAEAALAAGDAGAAKAACEASWRDTTTASTRKGRRCPNRRVSPTSDATWRVILLRSYNPLAEAALACGDLIGARRWADDTVAVVPGWYQLQALTTRARVAIAQGNPEQAERDLHDALAVAAATQGYLHVPDTLECLAGVTASAANHQSAARLFGAANAVRQRTGQVRFQVYQAGYEAAVAAVRDALGEQGFDSPWAEGTALSTQEAIAYAQRGRGQRKRPTSGWESLTPTEREVVRLVSDGLANKAIATRLFVSPRTVEAHLTHVYSKLGLTGRVQLVQQAARRD